MIFRQLFDQVSSTYSYLLADERTREAVFIDSVFEQHARDVALIRELELKLLCTLETHCHADHVTGAWLMRVALGCKIGLSPKYGATNVDLPLVHGDTIHFGAHSLEVRGTPGHTDGCLSFVTADHEMVFTARGARRRARVGGTRRQTGRGRMSDGQAIGSRHGHSRKGRSRACCEHRRRHGQVARARTAELG
jgi:hypothetical protein